MQVKVEQTDKQLEEMQEAKARGQKAKQKKVGYPFILVDISRASHINNHDMQPTAVFFAGSQISNACRQKRI